VAWQDSELKIPILISAATLTASLFAHSAFGLEPDSHLSDHMVLQRDLNVPVWGTAAPDPDVSVSFTGQEVIAKAILQKPIKASRKGRVMTISGDGKELETQNALVGEVWVRSGQSNMAG
jgi:sialate O-acetylesterase